MGFRGIKARAKMTPEQSLGILLNGRPKHGSIIEAAAAGAIVGSLSISADEDPNWIFQNGRNTGGGRFTVSGTDLVATAIPTDFETATSYSVDVRAFNTVSRLWWAKTFVIDVQNVTETVSAVNLAWQNGITGGNIPETAQPGLQGPPVAIFSTTPFGYPVVLGTTSSVWDIREEPDDPGYFGLRLKTAVNYPQVFNLVATGIAPDGRKSLPFTITITNVNKAPTDFSLTSAAGFENRVIPEDTPLNTDVTSGFTVVDPDAGDTHTLSEVAGGDPDGHFNVVSGKLRLSALFDAAVSKTYAWTGRVTDQGGLSCEKTFVFTIQDVVAPPAPGTLPDFDLTAADTVPAGVSYARTGSWPYINSSGDWTTQASTSLWPREYNPDPAVTGAAKLLGRRIPFAAACVRKGPGQTWTGFTIPAGSGATFAADTSFTTFYANTLGAKFSQGSAAGAINRGVISPLYTQLNSEAMNAFLVFKANVVAPVPLLRLKIISGAVGSTFAYADFDIETGTVVRRGGTAGTTATASMAYIQRLKDQPTTGEKRFRIQLAGLIGGAGTTVRLGYDWVNADGTTPVLPGNNNIQISDSGFVSGFHEPIFFGTVGSVSPPVVKGTGQQTGRLYDIAMDCHDGSVWVGRDLPEVSGAVTHEWPMDVREPLFGGTGFNATIVLPDWGRMRSQWVKRLRVAPAPQFDNLCNPIGAALCNPPVTYPAIAPTGGGGTITDPITDTTGSAKFTGSGITSFSTVSRYWKLGDAVEGIMDKQGTVHIVGQNITIDLNGQTFCFKGGGFGIGPGTSGWVNPPKNIIIRNGLITAGTHVPRSQPKQFWEAWALPVDLPVSNVVGTFQVGELFWDPKTGAEGKVKAPPSGGTMLIIGTEALVTKVEQLPENTFGNGRTITTVRPGNVAQATAVVGNFNPGFDYRVTSQWQPPPPSPEGWAAQESQDRDCLQIWHGQDILTEQCQFMWAIDECFSIWNYWAASPVPRPGGVKNVEIRYCIFAEGPSQPVDDEGRYLHQEARDAAAHNVGSLIGYDVGVVDAPMTNFVFHHNVMTGFRDRCPYAGMIDGMFWYNNLVHNWVDWGCHHVYQGVPTTQGVGISRTENNLYSKGPQTKVSATTIGFDGATNLPWLNTAHYLSGNYETDLKNYANDRLVGWKDAKYYFGMDTRQVRRTPPCFFPGHTPDPVGTAAERAALVEKLIGPTSGRAGPRKRTGTGANAGFVFGAAGEYYQGRRIFDAIRANAPTVLVGADGHGSAPAVWKWGPGAGQQGTP